MKHVVKYKIDDYSNMSDFMLSQRFDHYEAKLHKLHGRVPTYKAFKAFFGVILNVYNIIEEMKKRGLDTDSLDFEIKMNHTLKNLGIDESP